MPAKWLCLSTLLCINSFFFLSLFLQIIQFVVRTLSITSLELVRFGEDHQFIGLNDFGWFNSKHVNLLAMNTNFYANYTFKVFWSIIVRYRRIATYWQTKQIPSVFTAKVAIGKTQNTQFLTIRCDLFIYLFHLFINMFSWGIILWLLAGEESNKMRKFASFQVRSRCLTKSNPLYVWMWMQVER